MNRDIVQSDQCSLRPFLMPLSGCVPTTYRLVANVPNLLQVRLLVVRSLLVAALSTTASSEIRAEQINLEGPPGSVSFGAQIAVLQNGNIVVTDPRRPPNGAAYLYSPDRVLISTVTNVLPGAHSGVELDRVKIVVLANGNYLLTNPNWRNGSLSNAGMVAWASGESGLSGEISSSNALVGSSADERVGFFGVEPLANGNYIVSTLNWNNGTERMGAVTWGSGRSGVSGVISPDNSVVGGVVSIGGTLTNGNYVVIDVAWGRGAQYYFGAVMWADGTVGATGFMTAENAMIGSTAGDFYFRRVFPLSNGNFVVTLPYWDNGSEVNAGAAVWMDGTAPTSGVISSSNALVGARAGNFVGYDEVQALANGNYVVVSSDWEDETGINLGAVTWANGETGLTGEVSAANSLIGGADFQFVGGDPTYVVDGVTALTNGHYVVATPNWRSMRGAITWGDGTRGIVGVVSPENSLVGASAGDQLGISWFSAVTPLTNGNYVVAVPAWHNADGVGVGAAVWVDGSGPRVGTVTALNSLTGSDPVNAGIDVVALANGNYVVALTGWDRGQVSRAGAVAWGDGTVGTVGNFSPETALVGAREWDFVGWPIALTDGNYIVCSQHYSTESKSRVGAITWGSGWGGLVGEISPSNSLVGSTSEDRLCGDQYDYVVPALPDGRYVVASLGYDDGDVFDAGAFTFADGPLVGHVDHENSVIGSVIAGGENGGRPGLFAAYDFVNNRLAVGRPASNVVTLKSSARIFRSGFGQAHFR
jgi:hypothetical protein